MNKPYHKWILDAKSNAELFRRVNAFTKNDRVITSA